MLINGVSETVTLGAPMLGNMLTGKGAIKAGKDVI